MRLIEGKFKKSLFLSIFAGLLLMMPAARADFDAIQVLESGESGILLKYVVPKVEINPYKLDDGVYYYLAIAGTSNRGLEGKIEIPVKVIPIALPPNSIPEIRIIDSKYSVLEYKPLLPYYSKSSNEELDSAYRQALKRQPDIPSSEPYLITIDEIRGLTVARIGIPTARYSYNPQDLSVLEEITIQINFNGAGSKAGIHGDLGPAYGRLFRQMILNFDAAANWFLPPPESILRQTENFSAFDSANTWVKIELLSEGIYQFGWLQFDAAGIAPLSVNPDQVRVFYAGGRELPILNSDPRPQLIEIPIQILGGNDGQFDNGDYIIFYADAVDTWDYNSQLGRYAYIRNHYTDRNVYWMTIDGEFSSPPRRFTSIDASPDGSENMIIDSYESWFHKEEERVFWRPYPTSPDYNDYFEWYWGFNNIFSTTFQLFDVVTGESARAFAKHQGGSPSLMVDNSDPIPPVQVQGYSRYAISGLNDGTNTLSLQSSNDFYLNFIDVYYKKWLRISDGTIKFVQPETSGVVRYDLNGTNSNHILLDITDKFNPRKLLTIDTLGQSLSFKDTIYSDSHKRYYYSSRDRFKNPATVSLYMFDIADNLRDVYSSENNADILFITYDGFEVQAQRLADHRSQTYGLRARVVKISDIFNQFSFGLFDPVAIRDFLKYAYQNWQQPAPSHVILFGDGNYDYRNNIGSSPRNYIPPFENNTYFSDDHFIYFGRSAYLDSDSNAFPDMLIGRISVRNTQEAEEVVNKIIAYDVNPDFGRWKNRVVIAADDNIKLPYSNEVIHTLQAENLGNIHTPRKFNVAKIYMIEYPMRTGNEKPEAREALVGAFNLGSLIINWIGHGSPNLWADEHIFRRIEDIPRLVNGRKLPLVFTASCTIGAFDLPNLECMAEDFLRTDFRGAIGVISPTRPVYPGPNAVYNNLVYDQLLRTDSVSMGEAVYVAKFLNSDDGQTIGNDRLFMYFGDPTQFLGFPKFDVRVTSAPDSLVALSVNTISGEITDNNGNLMNGFNGTVWLEVRDGEFNKTVVLRDNYNNPLNPPYNTLGFLNPGPPIFVGPADVFNGQFSSQFFVPKDVSYGSRGAKIYTYAENGTYDAIGIVDSLLISGSLPSTMDSTGPAISLFVDDRPFHEGVTMVPSSFALTASIVDSSGINITGQLGHGIVLGIDQGETYEADITGFFNYDRGDYQSGSLTFQVPEIPIGEHTLTLKAWDNQNISTSVTFRINAVSADGIQLSQVMNYPNPVRDYQAGTAFQYCLNEDADRVIIKIFTESGRKIKTIELNTMEWTSIDCHQYQWNLIDEDGDKLANGIYIYKITVEQADVDGSKSCSDEIRKLAIVQ